MVGVLILLGHLLIMLVGWKLNLLDRHTPSAGDPRTLFAGGVFIYWTFVLFLSARGSEDWLLRFLNRRESAAFLAIIFGLLGAVLAVLGSCPVAAP